MAKDLGGNSKVCGELVQGKEMTLHMNALQVYQLLLFSFFNKAVLILEYLRAVYLPVGYSGEQLGFPHSLVTH